MNFERGQDPKTAMGVGGIKNPLTIISISYPIGGTNPDGKKFQWWGKLEGVQIHQFLNYLEKANPGDSYNSGYDMTPNVRFEVIEEAVNFSKGSYTVSIGDLAGRCVRVEFELEVYRIPKHFGN